MSDIPFLEEKISQLDMNDDLSKFNADYVLNMNKMGYLCLPDGSVVQAPKMVSTNANPKNKKINNSNLQIIIK